MDIFHAVILGIVQGITEWLPVSSSAHLVMMQLAGITADVLFYAGVHIGTLLAVLIFLRKEISEMLKCIFRLDFSSSYGRMIPLVIIGTLPAAFFGLFFRDFFESLFYSTLAAGIGLLITGCILYASGRKPGSKDMGWKDSLLIGLAQAAAIVPGVSRSGSTIGTALAMGIDREKAARFSFLLSIPAIAGAFLLESGFTPVVSGALIAGMATSFVVGYISLKFLMKVLMKGRLRYFAYYCWAVGAAIVIIMLA